MNWLTNLFFSQSIAQSIVIIAITIALGIYLGKIKIFGVSLGITWILFAGLILSHFGMTINNEISHFIKEFGLILFVYSIGLQVGPGFFSSLKKGGLTLNLMATAIVILGAVTTYVIHLVTGEDFSTMVGVMTGAITNTPSLGAAQQTFIDITNANANHITLGYAVAYPLGVVGIILSMIIIRFFCKSTILKNKTNNQQDSDDNSLHCIDVKITNKNIIGKTIQEVGALVKCDLVISRIIRKGNHIAVSDANINLLEDDIIRVVSNEENIEYISLFLGEKIQDYVDINSTSQSENLVNRRIVVTKENVHGKRINDLKLRTNYGINITRINRAGINLLATNNLRLQLGDRITMVGSDDAIAAAAKVLGNSMKKLDHPNLFPIFVGIALGVILGSIPISFPNIPQSIKLGLAGGPLIVAILIAYFGPYYKLVTFTTTSANMMLREVGISLFLATVGLSAGGSFVDTITNGGYWWILYGAIITIVPLLIVGFIGTKFFKLDNNSLMGLLAGSTTDPPALAYANGQSTDDKASVTYATVYPLTMFLRVIIAQIMILYTLS